MTPTSRTSDLLADTRRLADRLGDRSVALMEVCGTHTMAISRLGLRSVMPANVRLTSGPGCPVCVTPTGYIDAAIELARRPEIIVATFGDMMRVPGTRASLSEAHAQGARVEIVYSPLAALTLARTNPDREVVFLGVGFETTAPAVAACVRRARREKLPNFSVLVAHKIIPPAMAVLLADPQVALDGFICPGHVSVVIGSDAYRPIVERFSIPCVVTGFEAPEILTGINMLLAQLVEHRAQVECPYSVAVSPQGNLKARKLLEECFVVEDTDWRGLGTIPASGLRLIKDFEPFDAARRFTIEVQREEPRTGCRCGQVMRSIIEPEQCPLFASVCRPESPVGPCMVSSEGVCAAHYRYDRA
jgi:hydrogenase expression/formation protein HypD